MSDRKLRKSRFVPVRARRALSGLLCGVALALASHAPADAQANPGSAAPRIEAKEAADYILADTLNLLLKQTDAHFHEGEYNHIINLNRIVVQGDPKNTDAWENASYLLWSTTRTDDAIALLKQGIKANPKSFSLYDELGNIYAMRLKKPAAAIPYYEQAVKYKPPYLTWHGLAHCYEKTKQWDKALKAWETAAQYPNNPAGMHNLRRVRQIIARQNGR